VDPVKPWLGRYVSALALGGLAAVLLLVGVWSHSDTALGAGLTLVGGAVVRGLDIAQAVNTDRQRVRGQVRRDLDETRRVLYIVQMSRTAPAYAELVGTAVNALVHHGLAVPRDDAMNEVIKATGPAATGGPWVDDRIADITRRLATDK
jgi:hypothetical protein